MEKIYCNACCQELSPTDRWMTDRGDFHGLCSKCALIQSDIDHKNAMSFIKKINADTTRMEKILNGN